MIHLTEGLPADLLFAEFPDVLPTRRVGDESVRLMAEGFDRFGECRPNCLRAPDRKQVELIFSATIDDAQGVGDNICAPPHQTAGAQLSSQQSGT